MQHFLSPLKKLAEMGIKAMTTNTKLIETIKVWHRGGIMKLTDIYEKYYKELFPERLAALKQNADYYERNKQRFDDQYKEKRRIYEENVQELQFDQKSLKMPVCLRLLFEMKEELDSYGKFIIVSWDQVSGFSFLNLHIKTRECLLINKILFPLFSVQGWRCEDYVNNIYKFKNKISSVAESDRPSLIATFKSDMKQKFENMHHQFVNWITVRHATRLNLIHLPADKTKFFERFQAVTASLGRIKNDVEAEIHQIFISEINPETNPERISSKLRPLCASTYDKLKGTALAADRAEISFLNERKITVAAHHDVINTKHSYTFINQEDGSKRIEAEVSNFYRSNPSIEDSPYKFAAQKILAEMKESRRIWDANFKSIIDVIENKLNKWRPMTFTSFDYYDIRNELNAINREVSKQLTNFDSHGPLDMYNIKSELKRRFIAIHALINQEKYERILKQFIEFDFEYFRSNRWID